MKIPKIERLPSGRYRCHMRLDGQSVSITEDTEDLCRAKALAIKTGVIKTKKAARTHKTLRAAIDDFIDDRMGVISPSTIRGYKGIQRTRFQGVMDKPISAAVSWQKVISQETQICAPKTIKNAWSLVSSVLKENGVDVPCVRLPQIAQNEHPFLQPDEIPVFIAGVKDKLCAVPALLALHSLRRSEILGLQWENVDLERGLIHIRGALVYGDHNEPVHKATNKTVSSTRTVPIMIPELHQLLAAVEDKTGNVVRISPNAIFRGINAVCEANGFPRVGIHGLRHSFASLAYHLGLSEMETMRLGGWSDTQTMRKIYTHLAEKDRISAHNKMSQFFQINHAFNHE